LGGRPSGKEARRPLVITRYPGGKWYLFNWILRHLPDATRYVEAFAGSVMVLLNRIRAEEEIVIEKNPDQAVLLRVIRDQPEELIERLRPLRWDRLTFLDSRWLLDEGCYSDDLALAILSYTVRRMSWGGIGRTFSWMYDRDQQRRWDRGVERLRAISERLQGVRILEGDAQDWLATLDGPDTLFYLDPPYLRSVRSSSSLYGQYEMSDEDHRSLCLSLRRLEGRVVLSGYPSPLYDQLLGDWKRVEREAYAYARPGGGPRSKKTEALWMNF
jgi:DNA adenine methylase